MTSSLNISEIYEQNLNFLVGSGASHGFLPTLQLSINDSEQKKYTIETLSVDLKDKGLNDLDTLLFMYYYTSCIEPAMPVSGDVPFPPSKAQVIGHYTTFFNTIIATLKAKSPKSRKCNVYTTNYDGCLEYAAEKIVKLGAQSITFNDGASGFKKRYFHTKNYDKLTV